MFRQIYSFDGVNKASKRTKINNVRYIIPHTNNSFTKEFGSDCGRSVLWSVVNMFIVLWYVF